MGVYDLLPSQTFPEYFTGKHSVFSRTLFHLNPSEDLVCACLFLSAKNNHSTEIHWVKW